MVVYFYHRTLELKYRAGAALRFLGIKLRYSLRYTDWTVFDVVTRILSIFTLRIKLYVEGIRWESEKIKKVQWAREYN